mmetsp:Transcript_22683/g.89732  ORF Transcript_22683/g.89732 Transcript_22683/m.89732 type:complete len:217 (-) Transcript_22683:411-1061(-)
MMRGPSLSSLRVTGWRLPMNVVRFPLLPRPPLAALVARDGPLLLAQPPVALSFFRPTLPVRIIVASSLLSPSTPIAFSVLFRLFSSDCQSGGRLNASIPDSEKPMWPSCLKSVGPIISMGARSSSSSSLPVTASFTVPAALDTAADAPLNTFLKVKPEAALPLRSMPLEFDLVGVGGRAFFLDLGEMGLALAGELEAEEEGEEDPPLLKRVFELLL